MPSTATAQQAPSVNQPKHPLAAMTTYELRDYRCDLETAIAFFDRQTPVPRPVTGSRPSSMTSSPSKTTAPGSPPMPDDHPSPVGQLDLYGNQLTRCLKALGTDAPIRADVQRELATVRTEQDHRARQTAHA